MKKTSILLVATVLAAAGSTPAATFYDTTQHPPVFGGTPLTSASQLITVPAGQTWNITDMTADIGEGSQANLSFNFFGSGDNLVGSTSVAALSLLFNYVNVNFPAAITLTAGTYDIVPNYQITGVNDTSFWSFNTTADAFALSLSGSLSAVPEPSEWAAISLGVLGLVFVAKRRFMPAH
jgi:hypothetical protein